MSSRMPCHMPFLLFTLTEGQIRDKNFETDGLISPEYNSPSLTILVLVRHWLALIGLCPTCSKSAIFLESYTTNGERSGLRNTWRERKNLYEGLSSQKWKLNNFFYGSHLWCGNQPKQNYVKITARKNSIKYNSFILKKQEQEVHRLLQSWSKTTYMVFYNNISVGHTSLLQVYRC